jgi:hypothetical protein
MLQRIRGMGSMAGFVQGIDRDQVTLLPARLDEYVAEDNPVPAVDAFVDKARQRWPR